MGRPEDRELETMRSLGCWWPPGSLLLTGEILDLGCDGGKLIWLKKGRASLDGQVPEKGWRWGAKKMSPTEGVPVTGISFHAAEREERPPETWGSVLRGSLRTLETTEGG